MSLTPDAHATVRNLLEDMKAAARAGNHGRVEHISDELSVLTRAYCVPEVDIDWHAMHISFTALETRVANRLFRKPGQTVTKANLLDAMYFDRAGNEPDSKIVDVVICKIRKKLKSAGGKFNISNIWGKGYVAEPVHTEELIHG